MDKGPMERHPTLPHKRQREVDERAASNGNGMISHISTDMVQLFYCLDLKLGIIY